MVLQPRVTDFASERDAIERRLQESRRAEPRSRLPEFVRKGRRELLAALPLNRIARAVWKVGQRPPNLLFLAPVMVTKKPPPSPPSEGGELD